MLTFFSEREPDDVNLETVGPDDPAEREKRWATSGACLHAKTAICVRWISVSMLHFEEREIRPHVSENNGSTIFINNKNICIRKWNWKAI